MDLHTLVRRGDTDTVRFLLSTGADVNKMEPFGNTPLAVAARNGDTEMARLLLTVGADVHIARGYSRQTPLHEAAGGGYTEMVEVLLSAGADVNKADRNGLTPLKLSRLGFVRTDVSQMLVRWGHRGDIWQNDNPASTPVELKQLCRITIRRSLIRRPNVVYHAHNLPLPRQLIRYLMLGGVAVMTRSRRRLNTQQRR